jgi:hypothetical protein
VNLVEIDLLRAGIRLPLSEPPPVIADYYALVCRAWELPRAAFWTFTVRDTIPEIPVPLDPDAKEVTLTLRPCLDRAYDEGRYAARLRYDRLPSPRLHKPDADWARNLLAARTASKPD